MDNKIKKIYHAAIYVRLSKEDGDVSDTVKAENNSISNQKSLIREFPPWQRRYCCGIREGR